MNTGKSLSLFVIHYSFSLLIFMIQRVQTLFLFLISVAMGVALLNPLWQKNGTNPSEIAQLTALQYSQQSTLPSGGPSTTVDPLWYLAILMVGVAGLALYGVFQYRNRLRQTMICAINAMLLTAVMGIVLYQTLYKAKAYGNPEDQGTFLFGFYALIVALLFNALANRFIRRDERKVRDSDRFR
jgi:glucan phosphoethanolaminetransferase (alkaline phosphatase superfamily)